MQHRGSELLWDGYVKSHVTNTIAFVPDSTTKFAHPHLIFRGCRRYIYIICVSTRNYNNAFILEFILCKTKMADFERGQLEIQLEFVR